MKQAQTAAGMQKVHAVVGGFHLAPQKEDYVRATVNQLADINLDYIVPLHCSGESVYEMLKAEMPCKLRRGYMGTEFTFDA